VLCGRQANSERLDTALTPGSLPHHRSRLARFEITERRNRIYSTVYIYNIHENCDTHSAPWMRPRVPLSRELST